jgi:hypothetical protein
VRARKETDADRVAAKERLRNPLGFRSWPARGSSCARAIAPGSRRPTVLRIRVLSVPTWLTDASSASPSPAAVSGQASREHRVAVRFGGNSNEGRALGRFWADQRRRFVWKPSRSSATTATAESPHSKSPSRMGHEGWLSISAPSTFASSRRTLGHRDRAEGARSRERRSPNVAGVRPGARTRRRRAAGAASQLGRRRARSDRPRRENGRCRRRQRPRQLRSQGFEIIGTVRVR